MKQGALLDQRVVEPKKRMVGGHYGWAVHRFPIKGGRTMAETLMRDWAKKIETQAARPGYLAGLMRAPK